MTQTRLRVDGVFEGGGVKGIGLVGAVSVIEAAGYEFVNLAGTSAGAIVATLLATGYSAAEVKQIINSIDFRTFEDPSLIGRIPLIGALVDEIFHKGLYKGDVFLNLMRDLLAEKGIRTFRDLIMPEFADDERYRFKVRVVASDISRGRMLVLPQDIRDFGMAPEDLEVALAVRMSMSIPFFFEPVKLKESYIVDGAVLSNFPVELFDSTGIPQWPTFGFKLVFSDQANPSQMVQHPISGPLSELAAIFFTALEAHDAYYLTNDKFVRTIAIDTLDVRATDFNLTPDKKEALYQSGVQAANTFFAHWDFEQYKAQYRSGQPVPTRREQVLSKVMPDPEQLYKAIEAVDIVHVPVVEPSTELASLIEGLPAEFRVDVPREYNRAMLAYLNMHRDQFVSYISSIIHSTSTNLDVGDIRFEEGSLLVTVLFSADRWVRSLIGSDFNALEPVGKYPQLGEALHQFNHDLGRAAKEVGESFKGFFQTGVSDNQRKIAPNNLNAALRQDVEIAPLETSKQTPGYSLSGIQIEVAAWVPKRDETFGWWGVALAGKPPDKPVRSSSVNDPLLPPPGQYDVYWKQDIEHTPMLLAPGVEVKEDEQATVLATSGMRITVAAWVPKRDETFGWWGATLAGKPADNPVHWSHRNDPLLLPPGHYDVYWKQDIEHTPVLLVSEITVQQDRVVDIHADAGIQIEVAAWVPKRDKTFGWWGVALAGKPADNPENWSHRNDPLLLPPGHYDVYWKQDLNHTPMLLASGIKLDEGQVVKVNASSGIQ